VTAAVGNLRSGEEVITLLLDQRGEEVEITEEVVKAAAGNGSSGEGVMTLLLNRRGDEVKITEEVVKTAAGNIWSGAGVMTLLLNRRGDEARITEEVVKAAAGNKQSGEEVMTLLLDRGRDEAKITKEAVKATAANFWSSESVRQVLSDCCYSRFTIEELLRATTWAGDIDLVNSALARYDSLNIHLDNDSTLLQAAMEGGSIEIWRHFRDLGWTSNMADSDGWSLELVVYQSNNRIFDSALFTTGRSIAPGESLLTPSRFLFENGSISYDRNDAKDAASDGRLVLVQEITVQANL